MIPTREQEILTVLKENKERYLNANDIYSLISERWSKRNGLKSAFSVAKIIMRLNVHRKKIKNITYYKYKDKLNTI